MLSGGGGHPLCLYLYQTVSSKIAGWSMAVGHRGAGGSAMTMGTAMRGHHQSLAGDVAPFHSTQLGSGAAAAAPKQTLWSKVQETCSRGGWGGVHLGGSVGAVRAVQGVLSSTAGRGRGQPAALPCALAVRCDGFFPVLAARGDSRQA